jgi:magnesium transporter
MNAIQALLETFAQEHPSDVARLLDRGNAEQVAPLLDGMDREASGRLLSRMNPSSAAAVVSLLTSDAASKLLRAAGVSRAALILSHADATTRLTVLDAMTGREAHAVRRLLIHSSRTAGSIMDAMVLCVADDANASDALAQVRQHAEHVMFYVYVVDREQRLVGVTTLRDLLAADPDESVQTLMRDRPESIGARSSLLAIVAHPGWRSYHAMPVVDERGVMIGAIRYETARSIERELGQAVRQSDVSQTAGALAQLYAIGALGMIEWFTALSPTGKRGKRDRA